MYITASTAQFSFETNLMYNFNWGNNIYYEYQTTIENHEVTNFSTFIKSDNRYVGFDDAELINFLIENLNNGNFIGLLNGTDTLSIAQMREILYWNSELNACTNDSIRWYDLEKLNYVRIHQKWLIDTLMSNINNYVLGVTLLREDEGSFHDLFYIPFNNEQKKISINDNEIVFIRELKTKFPWHNFNKQRIAKILSTNPGDFYSESVGINKYNKGILKINNLDSLFKELNIFEQDLYLAVLNYSQGIYINQSFYIDLETNSINSCLNAISPLYPINSSSTYYEKNDDKLMYFLPLYWLNFRVFD